MELPHLFAQQRQSASQGIADSNAGVEVQDANQRAPPLGAPRWTVAGTVAQTLLKDSEFKERLDKFGPFHQSLSTLSDMEKSVQLAVAKETRDHKVLLKIRPQLLRQAEWNEAADVLSELVVRAGGDRSCATQSTDSSSWKVGSADTGNSNEHPCRQSTFEWVAGVEFALISHLIFPFLPMAHDFHLQ